MDGGRGRIGGSPYIGWIQDTEKYGGAELSNLTVIKAGRKLGFDFYVCTPRTYDKKELTKCDILVVNNFFFFKEDQFHFICDLLFEYGIPYIKYEHDHREIIGDQARPKFARVLFGRSFLNIFISPFQRDNHLKYLGKLVEPYFILPPAVDTSVFKPIKGIKRRPNTMVSTTGRLYESKGYRHLSSFILSKQDEFNFDIYTKNYKEVKENFSKLSNVTIYPPVENDYLPKVYSSAGYVIHLPHAYEACGRTIAEGLLCGCKPITNQNVGIRSFKELNIGDEEKFDIKFFKKSLDQGVYDFWKTVWNYCNKLI